MEKRIRLAVGAAIVGLAALASVVVYGDLPARMVTHWGIDGRPDGSSSRFVGAFGLPAIMAVTAVLLWALPHVDPRRERYEDFRSAYDWFVDGLLAFLLYVHVLMLVFNLESGPEFEFMRALVPAFAALYVGIGFLLEHAEPNWFVGIRTPWTLEDERVWTRTHELGGSVFKAAGVVTLVGLVLPEYWLFFVLGPVLTAGVVLAGHSYWAYRDENARTKGGDPDRDRGSSR